MRHRRSAARGSGICGWPVSSFKRFTLILNALLGYRPDRRPLHQNGGYWNRWSRTSNRAGVCSICGLAACRILICIWKWASFPVISFLLFLQKFPFPLLLGQPFERVRVCGVLLHDRALAQTSSVRQSSLCDPLEPPLNTRNMLMLALGLLRPQIVPSLCRSRPIGPEICRNFLWSARRAPLEKERHERRGREERRNGMETTKAHDTSIKEEKPR